MKLIDNDNTTAKVDSGSLDPGWYCIQLDCATGSSASVALYRRGEGATDANDLPFTQAGSPVSITASDPAKEMSVGDEHVIVQRSGGTDAITVKINKMTTNP